MKKITVREIMKLEPCYTKEQVKGLIGSGKTPLEILDLEIPKNDKFWLLLRSEYISERQLYLLACNFAQEVAYLNPDPRVQAAIDAERLRVDNGAAAYAADDADAACAAWAACAADAAARANIETKQIEMVRKVFIDMEVEND